MMPCPFCQSATKGAHHHACQEMRRIAVIDQQVGLMPHYYYVRTLLNKITRKKRIK